MKIPNGVELLTIFARKALSQMFDWVQIGFLLRVLNIELTFVSNLHFKPKKMLSQKICVISFLKR